MATRSSASGIPESQTKDNCFSLLYSKLPNTYKTRGESMTEHENEPSKSSPGEQDHNSTPAQDYTAESTELKHKADSTELDQVAQYRLKLEQTADLVARIRHEINNPLTGVLGQAQLLLREELSERARKRVQTIEDLALRLRDVVAQLREVQRPGSDGETSD